MNKFAFKNKSAAKSFAAELRAEENRVPSWEPDRVVFRVRQVEGDWRVLMFDEESGEPLGPVAAPPENDGVWIEVEK